MAGGGGGKKCPFMEFMEGLLNGVLCDLEFMESLINGVLNAMEFMEQLLNGVLKDLEFVATMHNTLTFHGIRGSSNDHSWNSWNQQ